MASVRLRNVWKSFGDQAVVKNVDLDIPDKEFFILVGPSGCGKTTTLRMIAGLENITEGTIAIDDRVVNNVPPKQRDIAMVFQNYSLYPHMTVYENMAFGLKLRRLPRREVDQRVREAADILGLQALLDRKPRALSGGQRQRVAVGRCIVRKPKAFLFDEPLSNLDAKLRVQMRVELTKLHDRLKATMIYVTHDQVEAMTMGDRICVMRDGEVQQVAPPLEVYDNPRNKFVAGFIGNPPMNFIPGRLEIDKGQLWFRDTSLFLAVPDSLASQLRSHAGKSVVLGIRPEDIYDRLFYNYPVQDESILRGRVEHVEPMGAETLLHVRAGSTNMVARVPPYVKTAANQDIELVLNLERIHVFDAETESALLSHTPSQS
jgi:multiple sugar transport system ATP-binding protein